MKVAAAAAIVLAAIVTAIRPDPIVTVSKWAEQTRVVAPEASAIHHGRWSNELAPYLVEPMDCLSLSDPCNEVVVKKSAQLGFTEAGLNMFGTIVDRTPAPMLIVLPTVDTARFWVKTKLEPAISATRALKFKVRPMMRGREGDGSTGAMKKFPGGFAIITGANSSADLQSWSVRVVTLEEVSEYPIDVGNNGDPVEMALSRTMGVHEFRKIYYNSTPGLVVSCRISKLYEASDQRRYFVPCPHCDDYHVLKFENLKHDGTAAPFDAYFVCPGCGSALEAQHKRSMVARGVWLKTYSGDDAPPMMVPAAEIDRYRARSGGGRHPGFAIWVGYSPFMPWSAIVEKFLAVQGDPAQVKSFTQRWLGEAYEESGETPDYQKLYGRREIYPPRIMPEGCLFCTLGADVQADRIEWSIWGWGIGKASWLIDKGIIAGNTELLETFAPLTEIMDRPIANLRGASWPIAAGAIDAGFNTQTVYAWVRRLAPRVMAVKGASAAPAIAHWHPPLGTPRQQDVTFAGQKSKKGVWLWPVGTWQIKSTFYANLRTTIDGPRADGTFPAGYVHMYADVDETYLRQLTAEELLTRTIGRQQVQEWVNPKGRRNEALDCRVYATAAAVHMGLEKLTPEEWLVLATQRGADPVRAQMELSLWAQGLVGPAPAAPADDPMASPAAPASAVPDPRPESETSRDGESWIGERKGWL